MAGVVKPLPRRGVPFYDVERGKTMILPPGGGKLVEYRPARQGFSAKRALRRAGVRTGDTVDRGAARVTRALPSSSRDVNALTSGPGWGALLFYVFLSVLGLALLHNALGGRGPAGVQTVLGWFGNGIGKLVNPNDPLVAQGTVPPPIAAAAPYVPGSTASTKTDPGSSPYGDTGTLARKGAGVVAAIGKIIGLPGQGTHSYTAAPNNWQSDNAVDYSLPVGTPIRSPVAGVVVNAGYEAGQSASSTGRFAGQRVTIQGPNGIEFFLAHLSSVLVHPGEVIGAGTVIGQSGSANGVAHLHFAVSTGNPLDWLLAAK